MILDYLTLAAAIVVVAVSALVIGTRNHPSISTAKKEAKLESGRKR